MSTPNPGQDAIVDYDEFSMFGQNMSEYSIDRNGPIVVSRVSVELPDDREVSVLRWGTGEPQLVLVHGTAQNAHTWDTVAIALGCPLLAVDLPGHGHSSWREDLKYTPQNLADDVAVVVARLAPSAKAIVGMSLGGLTCLVLADRYPQLVKHLVMVDITPGVTSKKAKEVLDFIDGPQSFASFTDLLARTTEHNPTRSVSSLRRGILHNARQLQDGSWEWRYDRRGRTKSGVSSSEDAAPRAELWDAVSRLRCPLLVVRGGASPVVDDEDIDNVRRSCPHAEIVVVDGAGHSVQGDRPIELASLLRRFA